MTKPHRPEALRALTGVDDLIRAGLADPAEAETLAQVEAAFRIRIPPALPLDSAGVRAQVLPQAAELDILPEERADPIGDIPHLSAPGLTHRYPDRAILHATQTCAVYCRFCFRRETVGDTGALSDADFAAALAYLRATPAIREVILTGGDPLTLSPRRLDRMLADLETVPSLELIRIHSRIPVVAPERVTEALVATLDRARPVWLVVHANHPDEITPAAAAALRRLTRAGIPLLAQTVLLKGVNADPDTLERLFRTLLSHRVKPYYLHHPDLAKGTAHFRLPLAEGQAIMATLRARLTGIALPTYVLDIPGGHGKVPVGPGHLQAEGPGQWQVTDPTGRLHSYRDIPA